MSDTMLTDLSDLQESDESYWITDLSMTIETRDDDGSEVVQREYTFSWGEEFEEWQFSEYKERRAPVDDTPGDRDWRTGRHVWWHETGSIDVDIPQFVSDKLADRLGCDEVDVHF